MSHLSPLEETRVSEMLSGRLLTLVFEAQKRYEKLVTDSSSLTALRRFSCAVGLTTCAGTHKHCGMATDFSTMEHEGRRKQHMLEGYARELKT